MAPRLSRWTRRGRPVGGLLALALTTLSLGPDAAAARKGRAGAATGSDAALAPELERVLGSRYEVFHELSERALPGRILIRGPQGLTTWKSDCVAAEPQRYARVDVNLQNTLSGGVQMRVGAVGGQADRGSSLSLSFADPEVLSIEEADLVLREACVERLAAEAASGRLGDLVLVQEALFARISGCKEVETGAAVRVGRLGVRGRASAGCQIYSVDPVAIGFRGRSLVDLPQLRHLRGLMPATPTGAAPGSIALGGDAAPGAGVGASPTPAAVDGAGSVGTTRLGDSVDILADVQRRQQSLDSAEERAAATQACLEREAVALRERLLETWVALIELQARDREAAIEPMAALVERYHGVEVSCTDSLGQEHRVGACDQPGEWAWWWQCAGGSLDRDCLAPWAVMCAEFGLFDVATAHPPAVRGATLDLGADVAMTLWPAQARAGRARMEAGCDADDLLACAFVGYHTYYGSNGFEWDEKQGFAVLTRSCEGGVAEACGHVSTLYGAAGQLDVSHRYEVRACELGLADSCSSALIYNEDAEEVRRLLERGCALGDAELCEKRDALK